MKLCCFIQKRDYPLIGWVKNECVCLVCGNMIVRDPGVEEE